MTIFLSSPQHFFAFCRWMCKHFPVALENVISIYISEIRISRKAEKWSAMNRRSLWVSIFSLAAHPSFHNCSSTLDRDLIVVLIRSECLSYRALIVTHRFIRQQRATSRDKTDWISFTLFNLFLVDGIHSISSLRVSTVTHSKLIKNKQRWTKRTFN